MRRSSKSVSPIARALLHSLPLLYSDLSYLEPILTILLIGLLNTQNYSTFSKQRFHPTSPNKPTLHTKNTDRSCTDPTVPASTPVPGQLPLRHPVPLPKHRCARPIRSEWAAWGMLVLLQENDQRAPAASSAPRARRALEGGNWWAWPGDEPIFRAVSELRRGTGQALRHRRRVEIPDVGVEGASEWARKSRRLNRRDSLSSVV